jgi:hypothetical protein
MRKFRKLRKMFGLLLTFALLMNILGVGAISDSDKAIEFEEVMEFEEFAGLQNSTQSFVKNARMFYDPIVDKSTAFSPTTLRVFYNA